MRIRRNVTYVDLFLRKNYEHFGADFCAKELEEPVKYIRKRAQNLSLCMPKELKESGRPGRHHGGRISRIDEFVREHYADKGADFCASAMSEPSSYIRQRAHMMHISTEIRPRKQRLAKPAIEQKPKKQISSEIDRLKAENAVLRQRVKTIRLELIKVIKRVRRE